MESDENLRPNAHQKGPQSFPSAAKSAAGSVAQSDGAQGGSGSVLTKPYSLVAAAASDAPNDISGGSGSKRKSADRAGTVSVYCNASEYGGGSKSVVELDFAGYKNLDEAHAAVCKGLALPSSREVQMCTLSGDAVTLDELQAPPDELRLLLRIDGALAKFRMPERVRSNLPVKGFMNDLAACQYTLLSALCELIDNSVQATRRNERPMKRAIQIIMNTKHTDPACRTMLLTDNGEGFNAAASEEFATLGTSHTER